MTTALNPRHPAEPLLHGTIRTLVHAMYRYGKRELHRVPEQGPALLVCNHVSFVDAFIVAAAFKRPVRFIMDHRIYSHPMINWIFRIGQVIPIAPKRDDAALMESAFERTAAALRRGELVCIFPEGKITWDGELNPFRPGVERIVAETPVPVVPIALRGLWGSFFSRRGGPAMRRWPRRWWSKIELRAGRPVAAKEASATRLQDAVAQLRGGAR